MMKMKHWVSLICWIGASVSTVVKIGTSDGFPDLDSFVLVSDNNKAANKSRWRRLSENRWRITTDITVSFNISEDEMLALKNLLILLLLLLPITSPPPPLLLLLLCGFSAGGVWGNLIDPVNIWCLTSPMGKEGGERRVGICCSDTHLCEAYRLLRFSPFA